MRRGASLGAALLGTFAVLLAPVTATAEFGPIQLVSTSAGEQADEASAPAISADGRYLAFRGTIGGLRGVFRKDLESGAVVPVAAGSAYEVGAPGIDSSAPSISADGRYVCFATKAPLDQADDGPGSSDSDVYVADMSDSASPTYALASALDGSQMGLSYEGSGGSVASGRVALSADGHEVVFYTTAKSDLTSGLGGSTEGEPTPAGQIVLRNLETMQTTLVSAKLEGGTMTDLPVPGGAMIEKPQLPLLKGAALSADGSTVAWLGANLQSQVSLPPGEAAAISAESGASQFPYDEPLWRRVANGPEAPTRRVVAGDPSAPFTSLSARNTELNFAQGWLGVQGIEGVPQLSADGRTVGLIGNPTDATNAFVVDMAEGLSRAEAVRQLTREISIRPTEPQAVINQEPYVVFNGHLYSLTISPDGKQLAFATARQQFPLAPPNLIGSPPGSLGLVELYRVDLEGEILQRVTHGDGGAGEASLATTGTGQGGAGAGSPSFGDGGRLIAFSSTASNLVEGDGNEASDAFLVEDLTTPAVAGESSISAPPPAKSVRPRWQLVLSASSQPDGDVRLVATVPAAGALRVRAGARSAGERQLATTRAQARGGGPVALNLRLPRRYRRLVHSREGIYAMARVSFHGPGGKPLHGELEVRFRAHRRGKGGGR